MNLRSDFLSGLLVASFITFMNGLRVFRHADHYRSEGLLQSEILWSVGMFFLFIAVWMGSAAAGRWLRARFARKTNPEAV